MKETIKTLFAVLLFCLLPGFSAFADDLTTDQQVQAVFNQLRDLRFMQPGRSYTVRVSGREETGLKEQFLRRRTAQEISDSGLSCGCGDYAILFIDRIEASGFQALLVDGAEVSCGSLQDHFSGHAVVAIRSGSAPEADSWWLVDSTNLKVLSRNWSPAEKSFPAFGSVFWIGYCGPLAGYPVHNGEDLKAFYAKTLASIPKNFLNQTLFRLKFTIDASLIAKNGAFLNPRLADFQRIQADLFNTYGVTPEREIAIRLVRGGSGAGSDLTHSEEAGWVGHLGLDSGCSPSLLAYFERVVRNHEKS